MDDNHDYGNDNYNENYGIFDLNLCKKRAKKASVESYSVFMEYL